MTRLLKTFKMALIAGAGITTLMLVLPATAEAATCHNGKDKHGKAVMICGSMTYYAAAATASDDGDDDDDDDDDATAGDDDDQGTAFVDVEDCKPGKYWMMEMDDEGFTIPMACR
jgi:hypothetical protein